MVRLALIALLLCTSPNTAVAQSMNVQIAGQTEDQRLKFTGNARFNLFRRLGTVTGKLHTSEECSGQAQINRTFTSGTGTLMCGANLRATFEFEITSRVPLKGFGTATLSDGRKATLRLWR